MLTEYCCIGREPAISTARSVPPSALAHPDAELIAAFLAWRPHAVEVDRHEQALDLAEEATDGLVPPYPVAAVFTENDLHLGLCHEHSIGRRPTKIDIARLRDAKLERRYEVEGPCPPEWGADAEDRLVSVKREPLVEERARRDEIVSADDEWTRTVREIEERAGLPALTARASETIPVAVGLRDRIARLPARTMLGVALKAQVMRWCVRDLEAERTAWLAEDEVRGTDVDLGWSLSFDLMEMVGPALPLRHYEAARPEPVDLVAGPLPPNVELPAAPSGYQGDRLIAEAAVRWHELAVEAEKEGLDDLDVSHRVDEQSRLEARVTGIVAFSGEGLRAKASVLLAMMKADPGAGPDAVLDDIGTMAASLARDVLRTEPADSTATAMQVAA